ncbi:type VI secretion system lipoprotein TssJ [Pseudomonas sp. DTU_2021_1001937_2_SI_NGA_ILE_001]|uniref:type VI secretion system lipoprotein TssJ n=1 Tax=Pseudomonas sp. DTU_2021_1001937_2_SI_NGA_ILE_001 TaxID=3077589 RepID=UPI0025CD31EC|nr:type VI secretion system lipoprotein TssJ [Pseudomonas sp. DTU_2021_1001937_2_SI_NGA_ILE_001]WNW09926.1 type VI secretion system lipoprotein TssJ [Pseudomonas sp. DTU_2021_1001937_2_SI_NGA_ILE_001]
MSARISPARQPVSGALVLCVLLGLGGCAALSEPEPTRLDLTLAASERLNPDLHGRPSPVVVRLYELRQPAAFQASAFFDLYERARANLAADLLASEELELRPGETRRLKLLVEQGRYVGVLAGYRDLGSGRWRQVLSLSRGQRNTAVLLLDEEGLGQAPVAPGSQGGQP